MNIIASLVLYRHAYEDISRTLDSLLAEQSIDKVCIVDNGNHCDWLRSYLHPKVSVLSLAENKGFGAGHNRVFQEYKDKCEYILICNPDISFSCGEVDALFHFSKEHNLSLTIPKVIYPDGSLQHSCKLLPTPYQLFMRRFFSPYMKISNHDYELHHADYDRPFYAPSLSGCFMLISQQALNQIKGFDERFFLYMEDVDLSRRVSSAGLSIQYCPQATVVHESQRRSYQDAKFLIYHIVSAVRYFNKWGWFIDCERKRFNTKCLSQFNCKKS
ncbi:glycosyltransferase [Pantoea sp. NSTU24]|uniref:glycosyltransferase n=1 Tax=Pantoea sp. NSTU24 TaxID=3391144 RepID=UPI003D039C0B